MKNKTWEDYESGLRNNPIKFALKVVFGASIVIGAITGIGYGFSVCNESATVAQKELGPNALLQKYMWLKEAHAQLDKKQADIKVYQGRLSAMEASYNGQPRSKWAREDREQYNVWSSEVAGVKASYNDLASNYNAKMSEVNWKFCASDDLPKGATEPLPKEYAPYIDR